VSSTAVRSGRSISRGGLSARDGRPSGQEMCWAVAHRWLTAANRQADRNRPPTTPLTSRSRSFGDGPRRCLTAACASGGCGRRRYLLSGDAEAESCPSVPRDARSERFRDPVDGPARSPPTCPKMFRNGSPPSRRADFRLSPTRSRGFVRSLAVWLVSGGPTQAVRDRYCYLADRRSRRRCRVGPLC